MESNPYKAPNASVVDRDLGPGVEVTWARATKVWWSLVWRAVIFGGLSGMLAGNIVGAILGAAGVPLQTIGMVGNGVGLLVGIPVGIWVVRWVLRKSWSDFRIALLPLAK